MFCGADKTEKVFSILFAEAQLMYSNNKTANITRRHFVVSEHINSIV